MGRHREPRREESPGAFADRARTVLRGRPPDTGDETVPIIGWAFAGVVLTLLLLAALVAVSALIWPDSSDGTTPYGIVFVAIVAAMIRRPIRHLRPALLAGLVVGLTAGIPVSRLLTGHLSTAWAAYFGYVVGGLLGVVAFAAVTHLPTKRTGRADHP